MRAASNNHESSDELRLILNLVRDEMRPNDFLVAIASLIYLRWADFQEAEQEAIAAFDETDYQAVLPASFHWRSWWDCPAVELSRFFSEKLAPQLRELEHRQTIPLAAYLRHFSSPVEYLSRFNPDLLDKTVAWLADQPFETPNERRNLLDVFDSLLTSDSHFRESPFEFRTPKDISRLFAEIIAPTSGQRIYDPCFGTASLLIAAADYIRENEKGSFSRWGDSGLTVSGFEINPNSFTIGLTRLALAGINEPRVDLGNSLEHPLSVNLQRNGQDIVVANPPWGSRINAPGLDHYPIRTNDSTGLFIQHALSMLRPEGRAIFLVPEGLLYRQTDQKLRQWLATEHTIESVLALPESTMMPYTSIRLSILVIRKGGPTQKTRMVEAGPYFSAQKGKQPASVLPDKIKEIAHLVQEIKTTEYSWDVSADILEDTDWDFTPRRRDQSGLMQLLDSLQQHFDIVSIKECCRVFSGRNIKSDQMLDAPPPRFDEPRQPQLFDIESSVSQATLFDAPHIPFIRIKDVHSGFATKGSSWLSPEAANSIDTKWKLRAGDVLLSKSGTIGKSGVVRNGAVGAIAAAGFFVLRPDKERLDPHFLLAYLESSKCRSWLEDRSRGSTIKFLSMRVMDDLPVPLPSLQLQQRLAKDYRENSADVLVFLAELASEGEKDAIAAWIESALKELPTDVSLIDDPLDLAVISRLSAAVRPIRNEAAHGRHTESSLVSWVIQFYEAMKNLHNVHEVPRNTGLYSLLLEATRNFIDVEAAIKGNSLSDTSARKLTKLIQNWLLKAALVLVSEFKLSFYTNIDSLKIGELADISLCVENKGSLPLREINISTSPDWGSKIIGYLPENSKTTISLSGMSPKKEGIFNISVSCSAATLSGESVKETRELAFDIIDYRPESDNLSSEYGGSPYICGDPIRRENNEMFLGRDILLNQIRRQILNHGNVVLLEGNRRSGKTSILWHLEGVNSIPGWMAVYCSLQGAEGTKAGAGVPTVEVFREIAKSLVKSLTQLGQETPLPNGSSLPPGKKLGVAKACREGISEEAAFSDFREYAETALEILNEHNLGLVLMLDEFDKLQEGIDSGITSPQVPENIRFMVQTYPRFSAILTGSRRLKRLREEYWSVLFGLGTRFGVSSLSPEAARRLVVEPVKGRLVYSGEAVERAISITAGQPYILQCLCNRIFDTATQLRTRSVTIDLVDRAGTVLVEDNEHFASLWDYAGSERRRLLIAICHSLSAGPEPVLLGVIHETLNSYGIEIDDETLISDLDFLRELEVLDLISESGGGQYRLTIPLMGLWIDKQQDFSALTSRARAETEDQNG